MGEDFLVLRQFGVGLVLAAQAKENLREAIVRGGMLRLELDRGLQLRHRLLKLAEPLMRESDLEIQRGDGGINLLRLLEGLHRIRRIGQPHPRAALDVERGGGIGIGLENFRGLLEGGLGLVRREMGVGQVKLRLRHGGMERERLPEELDSLHGTALLKLAFAEIRQARELVLGGGWRGFLAGDQHEQERQQQSE